MGEEKIIRGEDGFGISGGFEEPEAEVQFAGTQGEDGVVELASHLQRPPVGAGGENFF